MDAITRSIVQAGLDASSYVAGARQVEAANRGMAASAEGVVTAGANLLQPGQVVRLPQAATPGAGATGKVAP